MLFDLLGCLSCNSDFFWCGERESYSLKPITVTPIFKNSVQKQELSCSEIESEASTDLNTTFNCFEGTYREQWDRKEYELWFPIFSY